MSDARTRPAQAIAPPLDVLLPIIRTITHDVEDTFERQKLSLRFSAVAIQFKLAAQMMKGEKQLVVPYAAAAIHYP